MKYFSSDKPRGNDSVIDTFQVDTDYVDSDGDIHIHVKKCEVMVTAKSDLDNLNGYEPSTIAYTAGLKNIWQLGADGTWVAIIEESVPDDGGDDSGSGGDDSGSGGDDSGSGSDDGGET